MPIVLPSIHFVLTFRVWLCCTLWL